MRSLTWQQVLSRRLARHFLTSPAPRARIVDVVAAVCGIHAQVMSSAEASLALRVRGMTARDLHAALWTDRTLVKTDGLRGTIHIFPAAELALWNAAMRAIAREDPRRLAYLGITSAQLRAIVEAIGDAVEGRRLTRAALAEEVARRVGRWAVERTVSAFGGQQAIWQAGLGPAANAGVICNGPSEGNRVTYVRPADWLGPQREARPEVALREVVRRYVAAYGPASTREVAQWLGAEPRIVAAAIEASRAELEEVDVEGAIVWQIAGDRPSRPRDSIHLVPRFDAYVVGSHPRDVIAPPTVVDRSARTGLFTRGGQGARPLLVGPTPVLLVDGRIAGIWESRRTGSRFDVRVQPLVRLSAAQREQVAARADRLGSVFGVPAHLAFGRVRTGPHL